MVNEDRRKSNQTIENTKVTGRIDQLSEAGDAKQAVRGGTAAAIGQNVRETAQLLLGPGYRARGTLAVVILAVVILSALLIRALVG